MATTTCGGVDRFGLPSFVRAMLAALIFASATARADDAGATTITIVGYSAGSTQFISLVKLATNNISAISSIRFSIQPKSGSMTRPISVTYELGYLEQRSYLNRSAGEITVPVFGLYDDYSNTVTLTYFFNDGSSRADTLNIATNPFPDPCGYKTPQKLLPRRTDVALSYDYMAIKGACGDYEPVVLDTDGAVRWVGNIGADGLAGIFFDNAFYMGVGPRLFRMELDGTFNVAADYTDSGVTEVHHNIDPGKTGILIELDTQTQIESEIAEVGKDGKIIKSWKLADIISAAMVAGGDDPAQFVRPPPTDWFHSNSSAYRKSDDSLLVSSRENFVICLDYNSGAIKWILGDPTKQWYQFPSLRAFALALSPGTEPPIGQHALSFTLEDNLMLFDNGTPSLSHNPIGASRNYSVARRYRIDTTQRTATEIWNYDNGQSLYSGYCSSIYQDNNISYLLDYAVIMNVPPTYLAQLVGLTSTSEEVFSYRYPTNFCEKAFNATPIHWEQLYFAATAQHNVSFANVSARGVVRGDDEVLIAGFTISTTGSRQVLVRGLGPSLAQSGIGNAISDPVLQIYSAQGLIASNDNYESSSVIPSGFIPSSPKESLVIVTVPPGGYTAILRNNAGLDGVGVIEVYDLGKPASNQ